jgi:hypothetical protein
VKGSPERPHTAKKRLGFERLENEIPYHPHTQLLQTAHVPLTFLTRGHIATRGQSKPRVAEVPRVAKLGTSSATRGDQTTRGCVSFLFLAF